jgi:UDP:flavonoid glycosyltransferase YjiC (YdhE family)
MSVETCRLLGRRGVLLTPGSDFVPSNLPKTVRHFEYVPFSTILPRAAAIVHHGGIGTTALALAAGIPQLVVPFIDDQFDNAVRVRRLGAGLKMSYLAYRPRTAARNLERLLNSKEIAQSCRALAARLNQQAPLAEACRLIEELALRRQN